MSAILCSSHVVDAHTEDKPVRFRQAIPRIIPIVVFVESAGQIVRLPNLAQSVRGSNAFVIGNSIIIEPPNLHILREIDELRFVRHSEIHLNS
jgi:hypothetical protein